MWIEYYNKIIRQIIFFIVYLLCRWVVLESSGLKFINPLTQSNPQISVRSGKVTAQRSTYQRGKAAIHSQ